MKTTFTLLFSTLFTIILHDVAAQLPYINHFDTANELNGWEEYQVGDIGSGTWNMTGGGNSAPNALTHDYNVGGGQEEVVIDWIVSPELNISGSVGISMSARESGFSVPTDDNCEVYIGTGSQNPEVGNYVLVGNLSHIGPQFTWIDTTFFYNIPAGGCYLAFRYKTIGAAWCTYAIDDVEIDAAIGISEAEPESIVVYPNPSNGKITVDTRSDAQMIAYTIYHSDGRLIDSQDSCQRGTSQWTVEHLMTGIYHLRIVLNDGTLVRKSFLVQ